MNLMVEALTASCIETPNDASLTECGKTQPATGLILSIKLQHGMVVSAIYNSFDHDPPDIFTQQINFIRKRNCCAMVGLLNT